MTLSSTQSASVCLVGAGPGDPGFITVTGLERLRRAQVVVYDALANPVLLEEAPADARRIDVGKRGGQHKLTQDAINQLLLDEARDGRFVVRLKGGDPYLFGRGAEEAVFLGKHGVTCEVIPGVTSGIAAPAAAGIPVTHRKLASTVTFVTGHEDPAKPESAVDYAALAKLIAAGGTVCFYMGVGRLRKICNALAACGLADSVPAAVVQWGTLPQQKSVRATLATVAREVEHAGVGSPGIVVVGPVAAIDEPGLDYFTARPLFGQTVLVMRTRQQASTLRQRLEGCGAQVIEAPTIEIVEPADWSEVDAAITDVQRFDVLALTSPNAVSVLADRLAARGRDARALAGVNIAVVGDATAQALRDGLSIGADLIPKRFTSVALADAIVECYGSAGRALLLRADIARPTLHECLVAGGWQVDEVVAYQTQLVSALSQEARQALRDRRIDWATFTSASTARNLVELLGEERDLLEHVRIASIGPTTSEAIRELGLAVDVQADASTLDALVEAIVQRS